MGSDNQGIYRSRWWLGCIMLTLVALLAACGPQAQQPPLTVVATIAPLADWAQQVGQHRVQVTQIVPSGVDPATYTLTAADRQALREARVVLCNGLDVEPWLDQELAARPVDGFVAFRLADFIGPLIEGEDRTITVPPPTQQGGPLASPAPRQVYVPGTVFSSYLWLSPGPNMAQRAVFYIGDTFARVDPQHIRFYRGNAETYVGELENLDTWVRNHFEQLSLSQTGVARRQIIQATDRSWYYFARQYDRLLNLRTLNDQTVSASTRQTTPLFVNRYSPAAATLPRAPDGVLDPLASDSYVEIIRLNVATLTQGLERARQPGSPIGRSEMESPELP